MKYGVPGLSKISFMGLPLQKTFLQNQVYHKSHIRAQEGAKVFYIKYKKSLIFAYACYIIGMFTSQHMRIWRNWQTRTVQVRVGNTMQVRLLLSAPEGHSDRECLFYFMIGLPNAGKVLNIGFFPFQNDAKNGIILLSNLNFITRRINR